MKKIILGLTGLFILTSCQQQKIGFVNNGDVINELQEKKDIEKKFQEKDKVFQAKRDSMVGAFQLEIKEAQVKSKRMSQEDVQALSVEFQQKEQLLGQKIQMEQNQLETAFQTEIDTLIVKVKKHIKGYGKNHGYDFILGTSETAASVLYGKDANDLTEEIRQELNDSYKNQK